MGSRDTHEVAEASGVASAGGVRAPRRVRRVVIVVVVLALVSVVLLLRSGESSEEMLAGFTRVDRVECETIEDDSVARRSCTLHGPEGPVLEGCSVSLGVFPSFSSDRPALTGCERVVPRTGVPGAVWDDVEAALAATVETTAVDFAGSSDLATWDSTVTVETAGAIVHVRILESGSNALLRGLSSQDRRELFVYRPGRSAFELGDALISCTTRKACASLREAFEPVADAADSGG